MTPQEAVDYYRDRVIHHLNKYDKAMTKGETAHAKLCLYAFHRNFGDMKHFEKVVKNG